MINSTLGDRLCTNYNANACPSDLGLAFGSWYMRCNLANALFMLSLIRSLLAS